MSGTKFIIHFEARPESSANLGQLLRQAKQDLQRAEGCRGATLFSAEDNPCAFTLMEDWETRSAHEAHVRRLIASGAWAQVVSHLAIDPAGRYVIEI